MKKEKTCKNCEHRICIFDKNKLAELAGLSRYSHQWGFQCLEKNCGCTKPEPMQEVSSHSFLK